MKWAFVDYENIGCLDKVDLSNYQKVIVFLGAKQPKMAFGETKYNTPMEFVIIQIKETQTNNLDFHLSYYLGFYDNTTSKDVVFDIISNDNGFAPLLEHVKDNGRICHHIKPNNTTAEIKFLISKLTAINITRRPQKIRAMCNYICSVMGIKYDETTANLYLNHLVSRKIIALSDNKIGYKK